MKLKRRPALSDIKPASLPMLKLSCGYSALLIALIIPATAHSTLSLYCKGKQHDIALHIGSEASLKNTISRVTILNNAAGLVLLHGQHDDFETSIIHWAAYEPPFTENNLHLNFQSEPHGSIEIKAGGTHGSLALGSEQEQIHCDWYG